MNTYFSTSSVRNTNSVQVFVRLFVWLISFVILGIISIMIKRESVQGIESFQSLGLFSLLFNAWLASVMSGMFYILPEWQNMVLLRLGKFDCVRKAGFFMIPPFIYSVASIVDIRIETHQVEATNTLTKDNVPTKVTAAVEFRVEDPRKAVIDVQNYKQSVIWLATEALKNTIGSMTLKELLGEREQIAISLKKHIDKGAIVYGIDVRAVRITDIDTPKSLVEELAVIARARRGAEAKQIQANAEVQVAHKISEASEILKRSPGSMRLRELQVLNEMSKEESSMVIVYPYGDRIGQEIASAAAGMKKNDIREKRKETQKGLK